MTIETNEALLAKAKDAKVLLSKDAGSATGLLSKAAEEAKALLNKAAEEAMALLNKAAETIEADEPAKVLLYKATEDANALLNQATDTAEVLLYEAAKTAEVLLGKATITAEVLLAKVKRLDGIIPICSYCKKIRDDQGAWDIMEAYITENSDAEFSHGVCPDCLKIEMEKLLTTKSDVKLSITADMSDSVKQKCGLIIRRHP